MTSQRFELGWLIAWNLTSEWISSCLTPFVIYLVIIIQTWLTPCAAGAPAHVRHLTQERPRATLIHTPRRSRHRARDDALI